MSGQERELPSQRVIFEGKHRFCFYACVPRQDFSALWVLARVLKDNDFPTKVSKKGRDIDGGELPDYLRGNVELWFSGEASQIAEVVRAAETFQVLRQVASPGENFEYAANQLSNLGEEKVSKIKARALANRAKYYKKESARVRSSLVRQGLESELAKLREKVGGLDEPLTPGEFRSLIESEVLAAIDAIRQSVGEVELVSAS